MNLSFSSRQIVDSHHAQDAFATLAVVLPAEFAGGAVNLAFGGLSNEYDSSATSALHTTVIGWHVDAIQKMKPITSGYRLVLNFDVSHANPAPVPRLESNAELVNLLRHILLSWKHMNAQLAPKKIIYLLSRLYPRKALTLSTLQGEDAKKVALVSMLGKKHGFNVGLAEAIYLESGYGEDTSRGYGGRKRKWYNEEPTSAEDCDLLEVYETELTVEGLVDLDGRAIMSKLDFNEALEAIPGDLTEFLISTGHKSQDFDPDGEPSPPPGVVMAKSGPRSHAVACSTLRRCEYFVDHMLRSCLTLSL